MERGSVGLRKESCGRKKEDANRSKSGGKEIGRGKEFVSKEGRGKMVIKGLRLRCL